jgi:hypothetical protein
VSHCELSCADLAIEMTRGDFQDSRFSTRQHRLTLTVLIKFVAQLLSHSDLFRRTKHPGISEARARILYNERRCLHRHRAFYTVRLANARMQHASSSKISLHSIDSFILNTRAIALSTTADKTPWMITSARRLSSTARPFVAL